MTVRDIVVPVGGTVIDRLQQSPETFYNFLEIKMSLFKVCVDSLYIWHHKIAEKANTFSREGAASEVL